MLHILGNKGLIQNQIRKGGLNKDRKDMKMRRMLMYISLIAIVSCVGCGSEGNSEAEKAAVDAAKAWLFIVDGEKYADSWVEAAELFKGSVQQAQWVQTMETARKPFGRNISRKLRSKSYSTSLPGAPDGEYVVIQFEASFENKQSAIETITPMLDKDGTWRVSGYFMK
jgi:hypothetical protein